MISRYKFLLLEQARSPLIAPTLRARIEEGVKRLNSERPLNPKALAKLRRLLIVEYIYNTNAIEGNTLTLRETRLVLEEGITIAGKPLRDHLEARNHLEALKYVEELSRRRIREFDLLKIHHLVMMGIPEARPGEYRREQVYIGGSSHIPPPPSEVPKLIGRFLRWLNGTIESEELHPVELAAVAHAYLTAIHPFLDGNGRVARLLMNILLMRYGYPLTVIRKERRREYYKALEEADRGRAKPIVNFVARAVDESLTLYLGSVTGMLPLSVVAKKLGMSVDYLGQLARKGYIRATKLAGRWYIPEDEFERLRKQ
ncbi:MAG: Fic family protein [Thermoproteota archaeon]|nr:MAG: Fic family protein [Candidatus Korarchaeota archaeon]